MSGAVQLRAVRLRAVRTVAIMLFVLSERARAITQGGGGADQDLLCSELFGSELFGQPHMSCLCTLRELEPLHKEYILNLCPITVLC